ncbi:putative amidoligase enzyme-domain-containing protein [Daldinia sp. FL1419]|nr:putative amidoligase enzyme-domain-containing protein [Daldinia sp. FL1419]
MSNDIKSSFGVEVELVIAIKADNSNTIPGMFRSSKGRPIEPEMDTPIPELIFQKVQKVMDNAAKGHEGHRVITDEKELLSGDGNHLKDYIGWVVDRDYSVIQDNNLGPEMDSYLWMDLEIKSPALFATEESFQEVQHVITALNDNFWIYAPRSAGLHVHYGRGKDWIPIRHLRRIAAFLFAADPILTQMHPPNRRGWEYSFCPSNRLYSILAHGLTKDQVSKRLGFYRDDGDYEEGPDTSQSGTVPVSEPPQPNSPRFTPVFQRGAIKGYELNPHYYADGGCIWARDYLPERVKGEPLDIMVAARELLSAPNAAVISLWMRHNALGRSAYNFEAYEKQEPDEDGVNEVELLRTNTYILSGPKRTIEFRQAAGTVQPDEVVAHARIAVGLCEYASKVDINTLWKMIMDLSQAETQPEWYDIFDLLFEIGLVNEAKVIQRRVADREGIFILDEQHGWFYPPNSRGPPPFLSSRQPK